MSSTSLGNPFPTDSRPMNGLASNTGRDKSISLRSAAVVDVSAGKHASGERVWRSGVVTAEEKLVGEEGQKVVVAAWLHYALEPNDTATSSVAEIHHSLTQAFPFPPSIPAPPTTADLVPYISQAFPGAVKQDPSSEPTIKATLKPVDFDQSAEIWARAGYDLTMWVLQYVQSQIASHKNKGDKPEHSTSASGVENHGLVGTGVSLTCGEGIVKTEPGLDVKQEPTTTTKTESTPAPATRPVKSDTKASINDKIPDSAYTLLTTASLPFPQFSIRKNFRTYVDVPVGESTMAPAKIEVTEGEAAPGAAGQSNGAEGAEVKPKEVIQRQINTGRYCPQVLGKEGSVRVAKTWLHAWMLPSSSQKVSSVKETALSNASRRATNKDSVMSRYPGPTTMTPLGDVYAMYTKYAFHPPQCPVLTYEEFAGVIRNTGHVQTVGEEAEEPLWTQPCSLVLRDDIPLDAWKPTAESPSKPKASKPSKRETVTLLQAAFRFDPNPGMDAEAYVAAGNSETTTSSARGANYKEHDMIWRSVGLNFARWIKAEKGKMKPKVESAAAEAERPSKRRKAEVTGTQGAPYNAGPSSHPGSRVPYNDPSLARASVMVRPVETITPEQRRRQIMAMWLNENYARHSDPNLRIEQKVLWAAFLTQVVRSLPPWESEIFTFMRPNELFGLTTEMWGTKLSSESPPGDIYGTQRQSFWICGIVARPANTTPKTSAIQPRNPVVQQAPAHLYQSVPQQPASSSRLQGFSASTVGHSARPQDPNAGRQSLSGYQTAPVHPSYGPTPTSSSYPSHGASRHSTHIPLGSGPMAPLHRNGTNPPSAPPRGSISGYVASQQPVNNAPLTRADYPPKNSHVPSTMSHGTTHVPSHRYMMPSSQPSANRPTHHSSSRPILPPPPNLASHQDGSSNLASTTQFHYPSHAQSQNGLPPMRHHASANVPEPAPR